MLLFSDTTKLQEAIQSGGMESVNDLLQGMTIPQRKAQLCAYYGGSKNVPGSPDNNDLYVRTSPMLHAARCGNSEAFSSLLSFTQELLKPQVGCAFTYKVVFSARRLTAAGYEHRSL